MRLLVVDSLLASAYGKLGNGGAGLAAVERVKANPEAKEFLDHGGVEGFVRQVREMLVAFRAGVFRF